MPLDHGVGGRPRLLRASSEDATDSSLSFSFDAVGRVLRQSIGVFGVTNDVSLPLALAVAWLGALAGLVAFAFVIGGRRERATLGVVGAAFALLVLTFTPNGFSLQGRHVLVVFLLWALCAAHMVCRRYPMPVTLLQVIVGAVVVTQAVALWVNEGAYPDTGPKKAGPVHLGFGPEALFWPILVGITGSWLVWTIARARPRVPDAVERPATGGIATP